MSNIMRGAAIERVSTRSRRSIAESTGAAFQKMWNKPLYKVLLLILGFPIHLVTAIVYILRKRKERYSSIRQQVLHEYTQQGYREHLVDEVRKELTNKYQFFRKAIRQERLDKEIETIAGKQFNEAVDQRTLEKMRQEGAERVTFTSTFQLLAANPLFLGLSFVPGIFMYIGMYLYSQPYLKYVFERLVMMVFVIFGVTLFVFTILYISPLDPAANILGQSATQAQLDQFNAVYGLDQPFFVQLWTTFEGLFSFDLGKSFAGNEQVTIEIMRKLPVTLELTVISLILAVVLSIPSGIISAIRQYSFFDYSFMLFVLIGLSLPNFWQGLIFILNFSIKLTWFPATYSPQNWLSMVMPVIVLGTGLAASIARMTRSSTLEVIHQDYIVTAKAKGLSERKVIFKHALGNALIPIVTVIGLQFGGLLGGAAVTEKVFNISGIGSYIVDKQFIPDIPSIVGGVIYIAAAISLVNLFVDILYSFLDPRIRSKMKHY
ncbi:ABC transporter permease [Paenibacillus marinisediminis]